MPTYRVPVSDLKAIVNPLDGQMWKCEPIQAHEVHAALAAGADEQRIWEEVHRELPYSEHRSFHINRIATMLRKGVDLTGITLILENHTPDLRAYFYDGNHRVAAAYLDEAEELVLLVAASDQSKILEALPGAQMLS